MRLVLTSGCFDLLHVGHIRHLHEAKRMGDYLVVGLTRDAHVNKPGRPIIPEIERKEMLEALECVNDVMLCDDSIEALAYLKPNIFCKGHDRKKIGLLPEELKICEERDIEIRFTKPNPQTTTKIVERIRCAS